MKKIFCFVVIMPLLFCFIGTAEEYMVQKPNRVDTLETTITIVYDNNPLVPGLETAWGFACVVEADSTMILFDTGGGGKILLENMRILGIDPAAITVVIISHNHHDHIGGLHEFLNVSPSIDVYIPKSFPSKVSDQIKRAGATPVTVDTARHIIANVYTLGEIKGGIPEQSMVLKTKRGLVLVTGCAHPGIGDILNKTKSEFPEEHIHLVLGGFHLGGATEKELTEIIQTFKDLNVEKVAPCHCTGEHAILRFQKEFGDNFVKTGVGGRFEIKPEKTKGENR